MGVSRDKQQENSKENHPSTKIPFRQAPLDTSMSATETSALLPVALQGTELLLFWKNPWILSVSVTAMILVPTLLGGIVSAYKLTGRTWPATLCSLHLSVALATACIHVLTFSSPKKRLLTSLAALMDIVLCGKVYPSIGSVFEFFFVDIDGTTVYEWRRYHFFLRLLQWGFFLILLLRILVGTTCWISILYSSPRQTRFQLHLKRAVDRIQLVHYLERTQAWIQSQVLTKRPQLKAQLYRLFRWTCILSLVWLAYCLVSCISHFTNWQLWWWADPTCLSCCDDLDRTECALPFPSFHHMVRDASSRTGWRVALQGLPIMRGGIPVNSSFLQDLDGFSTMAPILFYMEGLQERHQAESHGANTRVYPTLVDNQHIEDSVTNKSITLLWNVDEQALVPHTAQVDSLDPQRPLILVVPSAPLSHATHYAVAVINAKDQSGNILSLTPGMRALFAAEHEIPSRRRDVHRLERYQQVVLPSLQRAAPWLHESAGDSIQLLFDFVTMSEDSLNPIRRVRDATLQQISSWKEHAVHIVKITNRNCRRNTTLAARTIHGELSVPWWLTSMGRDSILSSSTLHVGQTALIGKAKFVIHIPCSLRAAALNETFRMQRPLRAILEYGHGLFYNRAESYSHSLLR
jgi:hypothetical protein